MESASESASDGDGGRVVVLEGGGSAWVPYWRWSELPFERQGIIWHVCALWTVLS